MSLGLSSFHHTALPCSTAAGGSEAPCIQLNAARRMHIDRVAWNPPYIQKLQTKLPQIAGKTYQVYQCLCCEGILGRYRLGPPFRLAGRSTV